MYQIYSNADTKQSSTILQMALSMMNNLYFTFIEENLANVKWTLCECLNHVNIKDSMWMENLGVIDITHILWNQTS